MYFFLIPDIQGNYYNAHEVSTTESDSHSLIWHKMKSYGSTLCTFNFAQHYSDVKAKKMLYICKVVCLKSLLDHSMPDLNIFEIQLLICDEMQ